MPKIKFFDATLRDGSHVIKHQFTTDFVSRYCQQIDEAGLDAVIVGHGNGLGASSQNIGFSKCSDTELLQAARPYLRKTKLGVYMIPGIGTIEDNILPAIDAGAEVFKIGCHCTEADTARQHISYLAKKNIEVYGTLMMMHMQPAHVLLQEVLKMQDYGAKGVILFDSAGASLPADIQEKISLLTAQTQLEIGYHGHNNLSLAVANSLIALDQHATIIDGTLRGFGAGAGNCQLEVLAAILQKQNRATALNLYKLLDISSTLIEQDLHYTKGISPLSIISGYSGVFSAFNEKVKQAASQFNVDPRDIFIELGKRKVVGGQEDLIIDVAMYLAQHNKQEDKDNMLESLL